MLGIRSFLNALKKINKSIVTNNKFLINKEGNIKIYYAPFDYVNSKAKIMIVGITPGFQQMLQSFQVINETQDAFFLADHVTKKTGLFQELKKDGTPSKKLQYGASINI